MLSRPVQTSGLSASPILLWGVALLVMVAAGCPTPKPLDPTNDTSPPVFVDTGLVVTLESPTPPKNRGDFDISSQDRSAVKLARDIVIRVKAMAGDVQSGIRSITTESELTWQCSSGGHSEVIGIPQKNTMLFPAAAQPNPAQTPWAIDVVADPISTTGCNMTGDSGPINIEGFVRVIATNGHGDTTKSKTFIFDYKDVGVPPGH